MEPGRLGLVLVLVFGMLVAPGTARGAAACPHAEHADVVVASTRFDPVEVRVCPGGTVAWDVQEAGHTIVADDGRFAFRGDGGSTLSPGSTPSTTLGTTGEFVPYRCEIHPSMRGRIVVGDGPPPPPGSRIRVPQDVASLHDAVLVAAPGTTVEIAPGTWQLDRPLRVDGLDLTITGAGGTAADVVLSGEQRVLSDLVVLTGERLALSNLTVVGGRRTAVTVTGPGTSIRDVVVRAGPLSRDGIVLDGVAGAGLQRVAVTGMARAAVEVRDCATCGVALDGVTVTDNLVGLHLRDAAGIAVHDLHASGNTTGVVARGTTRPVALTLSGSTVVGNTRPGPPPATLSVEDALLDSGAGIVLSGVTDSAVTTTAVTDHDGYGVALAGGPAVRTRLTGVQAGGNAVADLAWDGLGASTCIDADAGATTDPPTLGLTARCDAAVPASPPHPVVLARLLAGSTTLELS